MQRVSVKAFLSNKDTITTSINGGAAAAIDYYVGKTFNVGVVDDKMVYCHAIEVDGIRYNPSTHKYISDRAHEKNLDLIAAREFARNEQKQPLVGDFIIVGGEYLRFTHDWDESGLQTTCKRQGDATHHGGFHLSKSGRASYSGSLDPIIPLEKFELTEELRKGEFWMFNEDYATAHNGIGFMADCKVYKLKEEA